MTQQLRLRVCRPKVQVLVGHAPTCLLRIRMAVMVFGRSKCCDIACGAMVLHGSCPMR